MRSKLQSTLSNYTLDSAAQARTEYATLKEIADRFSHAKKRLLVLDYDGTLVEFTRSPDQALPTDELLSALTLLADKKETSLVLITGRDAGSAGRLIGKLPVQLLAEHG